MTSQRNNLLDAALACVMDVGLRRTTLADVARRAGVSRMTVYRAFPDLGTLVGALLTRELTQLLQEVEATLADLPTARERLVQAAVETVTRMDDHPLYRRVLDLDPELLLPLVVDRFGSTQVAAMALIAEQVRAGHADGSIRDVDPDERGRRDPAHRPVLRLQRPAGRRLARAELAHLLEAYLR